MKPHLWLIKFVGVIVPRRLRASWQQEWEAELLYRESLLADWERLDWRNKLSLLWHSLGAFMDALLLQPRRWEDEMIQDLRYGLRILLKSPAFTLTAILSLAIGIGANTALFSVINAVLWRPLPYPEAERLVRVNELSGVDFAAFREASKSFDGLAPWLWRDFTLTGRGPALQFWAQCVTPEFFSLLGFTPQAGRAFAADEFQPGHEQVAIISDHLWRSRFNADPQIIGQALTLSDRSYTVVGVAPPLFDFWSDNLFIPLVFTGEDLGNWCCLESVARLKQGTTLEQAQRELAIIAGGSQSERTIRIQPLRESVVKDFRLTLLAVWGVAGSYC
jgi:putative ABC transport system permease protein